MTRRKKKIPLPEDLNSYRCPVYWWNAPKFYNTCAEAVSLYAKTPEDFCNVNIASRNAVTAVGVPDYPGLACVQLQPYTKDKQEYWIALIDWGAATGFWQVVLKRTQFHHPGQWDFIAVNNYTRVLACHTYLIEDSPEKLIELLSDGRLACIDRARMMEKPPL